MAFMLAIVATFSFGAVNTSAQDRGVSLLGFRPKNMMTHRYMEAASKLKHVVISHYDPNVIVSYQNELMAAQTATGAQNWNQVGKHLMHYAGEAIPRFTLLKDQMEWTCGCFADIQQYPEKFDSNDLVVKLFSSKAGYFSTLTPPHLRNSEVYKYYGQGRENAVPSRYGIIHFKGHYNLFVVDSNHAVCAYGVWWTSGYVVGSADFTVVPDDLFVRGIRCGDGSNAYIPK